MDTNTIPTDTSCNGPTMDDAVAAGDSTLPSAIDHWQAVVAKKDAELSALRQHLAAALDVVCDLGGEVRVPEMAEAQARKAESDATRTTGFLQVVSFPDPNTLHWDDAQA